MANEYYLMTEEIYNAIVAAPANWIDISVFLDSLTLVQPHVAIYSFEGMQPETTFEFQWVVHYEGVPSSES